MKRNHKFCLAPLLCSPRHAAACRWGREKQRFVVLAMRRSGHHAVINWLCRQHGHRVIFHNLCGIKRIGGSEIRVYGNGNGAHRHIHNFENFDLEKINRLCLKTPCARLVLVVREARNWIASCLKRRETARFEYEKDVFRKLPERMALWKQHASMALEGPDWLTVILFDRWFRDVEYRRWICKRLDLPFTDAGLNEVVGFGNGSSFDGRDFDGKAQEMDVLNRWKEFEDDPLMKRMMTDEVMALNRNLFPDVL